MEKNTLKIAYFVGACYRRQKEVGKSDENRRRLWLNRRQAMVMLPPPLLPTSITTATTHHYKPSSSSSLIFTPLKFRITNQLKNIVKNIKKLTFYYLQERKRPSPLPTSTGSLIPSSHTSTLHNFILKNP